MAEILVRRAEEPDLPALFRLCRQASTAGVCPGVPMDRDSVLDFAERLMEMEAGALFVAEKDHAIIAGCGVIIAPYHFNRHVNIAYGVFLWRDVDHPGGGARVVAAAEKWSREMGAHKILLTTNDTLPGAERGAEFLARRAYVPEETNFVRTL